MKIKKTIIRELRSLMGLMRLGILLVAMVLTAGCSEESAEEPTTTTIPQPDLTGTAIMFSAGLPDNHTVTRGSYSQTTMIADGNRTVTRVAKGLEEIVTEFCVWGYKNMSYDSGSGSYGDLQQVFPGYSVKWTANSAATTTSNSHDWEYILSEKSNQTIKYWDWGARAYRFFAVAGSGDNGTYSATADIGTYEFSKKVDATAAESTWPYYSRLWFSTGNTVEYPGKAFGQAVTLQFVQPVAKVRFMFTYDDPSKPTPTLEDKSFAPSNGGKIERKGTVTVNYPLTGTQTQETVSVSGSDTDEELTALTEDYYETPDDSGSKKWYTVLPATGQGTYTLTVSVNGESKTAVVPAAYMDWLARYQYTYVFKIHVEDSDISVTFDSVQSAFKDWTESFETHNTFNW